MLDGDDALARMLEGEANSKAEGGNLLTDIGALLSDLGSSVGEFFGTPKAPTEALPQQAVDEQLHLALAGRLSPQPQASDFSGAGDGEPMADAARAPPSGKREPELNAKREAESSADELDEEHRAVKRRPTHFLDPLIEGLGSGIDSLFSCTTERSGDGLREPRGGDPLDCARECGLCTTRKEPQHGEADARPVPR